MCAQLWDSWDDDAAVGDKETGVWGDGDRVHPIDHVGEHFGVRGPLNTSRSPQGHPVLVQAGSSEDGEEFAARYAEAIFTAQQTLADAQEFYADIKRRAAATVATRRASRSCPASSRSSAARRPRPSRSSADSTS